MFKLGLCSVTFRDLSVEEVIRLAKEAELTGIAWGADVHVLPGNFKQADKVNELSQGAGLEVASYGSYYRVGEYSDNEFSFADILETAVRLNAPSIRTWAGAKGSNEADDTYRQKVADETRQIASLAAEKQIALHIEYHGNTLTDTPENARRLMEAVSHENAYLYWQPAVNVSVENRVTSIKMVFEWLSDVHVFQWHGTKRLPLEAGKEAWHTYLQALPKSKDQRYLYLEFVKDDSVKQFMEDAQVLKELIEAFKRK